MLDERTKRVLWAVVQSYIETPDPVGSRYVTKKFEFGVSPATIRNIMADLEELGYLTQPHTSAGRIPTDMGYRLYVQTLLNNISTDNLDFSDEIIIKLHDKGNDVESLLDETTKIISSFSHYLAVASPPKTEESRFHKIELISYRDSQIVVVLFTDEGMVRHKVISNDLSLKQSDLSRISSYLNSQFRGMSIREIRERVVSEMKEQKEACDVLISKALEIFHNTVQPSRERVFISGFREVVNLPDFSDIEKIKELSGAIEDKHTIIKLIDKILHDEGVQVVIGEENTDECMKCLSLVASPYKDRDRSVGVIGIIGPKRMNYHNAIVIVDTAARFISRILEEQLET